MTMNSGLAAALGIVFGALLGVSLGHSTITRGDPTPPTVEAPSQAQAQAAIIRKVPETFAKLSVMLGECTPGGGVAAGVMCAVKLQLTASEAPDIRSVGFARVAGQWEVSRW